MSEQAVIDANDGNSDYDVSQKIVYCYMREAELLFATESAPYYHIPSGLCLLTLSYVNNFCDNSGLYEWKIANLKLVNEMLTSKCGSKFESDLFVLSRIKCKLVVYPNGNSAELKGYFVIHLYLHLASFIDQITFVRVFRIKENMSGSSWLTTLSNGEYEYWSKNAPLSELIDLKCETITIQIELNVQRLYLKKGYDLNILRKSKLPSIRPCIQMESHIKYDFNEQQCKMLLNSEIGKCFCSDTVDNMWCIAIYPDGSLEQYIDFYLELCCLPSNVKSITAHYVMQCEFNHCDVGEYKQVFKNEFSAKHYSAGKEKWIPLKSLPSKIKSVTFTIDINIKQIASQKDNIQLEISNPSQIAFLLSG